MLYAVAIPLRSGLPYFSYVPCVSAVCSLGVVMCLVVWRPKDVFSKCANEYIDSILTHHDLLSPAHRSTIDLSYQLSITRPPCPLPVLYHYLYLVSECELPSCHSSARATSVSHGLSAGQVHIHI